MDRQPEIIGRVMARLDHAGQTALGWLTSPAAWSQFALLAVAYAAAWVIAARSVPMLQRVLTPDAANTGLFAAARRSALGSCPCCCH